jgi:hypothetical protein
MLTLLGGWRRAGSGCLTLGGPRSGWCPKPGRSAVRGIPRRSRRAACRPPPRCSSTCPCSHPVRLDSAQSGTTWNLSLAREGVTSTARSIAVSKGPAGVAVHPGSSCVYVADALGNAVSVIDAASQTEPMRRPHCRMRLATRTGADLRGDRTARVGHARESSVSRSSTRSAAGVAHSALPDVP